MAAQDVKRALAMILAAVVEAYSCLMRADEEATLETLGEYREALLYVSASRMNVRRGGKALSKPSWLLVAITDGVPKRSFIIALVVGTILNVINQGDALLVGAPVDLLKMGLTYIVPYCVATLGAVSSRLDFFNTAQK